jgi:hypothetical protein
MIRCRNDQVLDKWKKGEPANSHTGALHTNGTSLFSYQMKIGHRAKSGKARHVADHTMHPVVFQNSEFKNED